MVHFPFGVFQRQFSGVDKNDPDREICAGLAVDIVDNFPIRKVSP
jgi:hypothetical protein